MKSDHVSFVDGAVTDLVQGYGSIVDSLPNVANRVIQMQSATEDMANTLERRMRHLIDGYEYLDSISSQVPESIRETAVNYKKSMLDVAHVLGPSYEQNYITHTKELDRLRAELQSIAHERVVVDVLTRQSIKQAKRNKSVPSNVGKVGMKVAHYEPIVIPSFQAYTAQQNNNAITNTAQKTTNQTKKTPQQQLTARAIGNSSIMVPSMRQGVLPAEVLTIKTTPSLVSSALKKRCHSTCIPEFHMSQSFMFFTF